MQMPCHIQHAHRTLSASPPPLVWLWATVHACSGLSSWPEATQQAAEPRPEGALVLPDRERRIEISIRGLAGKFLTHPEQIRNVLERPEMLVSLPQIPKVLACLGDRQIADPASGSPHTASTRSAGPGKPTALWQAPSAARIAKIPAGLLARFSHTGSLQPCDRFSAVHAVVSGARSSIPACRNSRKKN